MGLKIVTRKTVSKKKQDLKKVSDAINSGKGQVEDLVKELKETKGEIKICEEHKEEMDKVLQKLENDFEKKTTQVKGLDKQIKFNEEKIVVQKKELDNIELEAVEIKGELEFEAEQDTRVKKLAIKTLDIKAGKLVESIEDKQLELKDLEGKIEVSRELIKNLLVSIELQNDTVKTKESKIDVLNKKLESFKSREEKLIKLEKEIDSLSQSLLGVKNELEKARRELADVNDEKDRRLAEVIKREEEVDRREKATEIKETGLRALEKNVKTMGETLQKHFDRHDMKHIRVFD